MSAAGGNRFRRACVHLLRGGLTSAIGDRRARTADQVLDAFLAVPSDVLEPSPEAAWRAVATWKARRALRQSANLDDFTESGG